MPRWALQRWGRKPISASCSGMNLRSLILDYNSHSKEGFINTKHVISL